MAKLDFQIAREATKAFLCSNRIENHMFHGPVSSRYWEESLRIVAINMESYGYGGHYEVDRDTLIDWLYDVGNTGTRTTRYTLTILANLLRKVHEEVAPSRETLHDAYANGSLLEQTLDRTVYFNIRPESNTIKEQDYAAIAAVGVSRIGHLIWAEIMSLDPHVVIVSGHAGLAALNGIAALDPPLGFGKDMIHPNRFVIQSISHPSRPNYSAWCSIIEQVVKRSKDVEQIVT